MLALLQFYVGTGIVSILVSLPLVLEFVKPNPFYGFRVHATLKDDTLWYAVNKFFALRLLLVGIAHTIVSLALYYVPGLNVDVYALSVLAVFVVVFSIAMFQSFRYLRSLQ